MATIFMYNSETEILEYQSGSGWVRVSKSDFPEKVTNGIDDILELIESLRPVQDRQIEELQTEKQELLRQNSSIQAQNTELQEHNDDLNANVISLKTASEQLYKTLTEEQQSQFISSFDVWETGKSYKVGDIFSYNNELYRVVQAHTSQSDWTPDAVPALYTRFTIVASNNAGEAVPEFVQPTGAHDAYNTGDLVSFEGHVYKSLIDANTYSPSAYPQGWEVVG
ncbi:MAG: sugar-binding protein [Coriobacteriia bacterium]|nr:sugar-binding protein [Coriobacteriia bacterium]